MGDRFLMDRLPWWVRFTRTWGNVAGKGRWCKRRLAKARRRAIKEQLMGRHPRKSLSSWESTCNWKGW